MSPVLDEDGHLHSKTKESIYYFKLINLEIEHIQSQFLNQYKALIEQKKLMIETYPDIFKFKYGTTIKAFCREMLLDPSECENSLYILP